MYLAASAKITVINITFSFIKYYIFHSMNEYADIARYCDDHHRHTHCLNNKKMNEYHHFSYFNFLIVKIAWMITSMDDVSNIHKSSPVNLYLADSTTL